MQFKDVIICRCEEVSMAEIEEAIRLGLESTNEVKRFTRAGMGLCQGKTCGKLVMGLLASITNRPPHELKPCTFRPPTRLISTGVLANDATGRDET